MDEPITIVPSTKVGGQKQCIHKYNNANGARCDKKLLTQIFATCACVLCVMYITEQIVSAIDLDSTSQ